MIGQAGDRPTLGALRALESFEKLDDSTLHELAEHARIFDYEGGAAIWNEGDGSAQFSYVLRGLVQIVKTNVRGDETMLGIFGPGEGVGNLAALEGIDYPASAIAASDPVVLLRIPAPAMLAMMKDDAPLLAGANRALIGKAKRLLSKIDVLSAGPVSARLALLFLHLVERFGRESADGSTFIPIVLPRSALARLIAAREETVIRVMSAWKQRGWVSTTDDGFCVYAAAMLQSAVASDSVCAPDDE